MVLTVQVLHIIREQDTDADIQISSIKHSINDLGGKMIYCTALTSNKDAIKRFIIQLSEKPENNIVIVIGDTRAFPNLSAVACDAIKEVTVENIFNNNLNAKISDLTKNLQQAFKSSICGIRGGTLVINMCGAYVCVMISIMVNTILIQEIMHLINTQDNAIDRSPSNNNFGAPDQDPKSNQLAPDEPPVPEEEKMEVDEKHEEYQYSIAPYVNQVESPMISVEEAIDIICDTIRGYQKNIECIETVRMNDACGRIVANNIFSPVAVPSYRSSAKRGFAVLASDSRSVKRVLATSKFAEISVVPGTCVRVRSGTPIPNGATAVVRLEDTMIAGKDADNKDYFNMDDKEYNIAILLAPQENDNIRNAGCQIEQNQQLLEKHSRIGPEEQGILTLCGFDSVQVFGVPSVGLLSIGNELEEPGKSLSSRRIYDSNRITLTALLKENDFNTIKDIGISPYEYSAIHNNIENVLHEVDVLVIMGRANDKNMLKPLLKECFDAVIHFGRVNMKPGVSTTFATCVYNDKDKYILCMSANPATVPIVAHLLLLPLLNEMRRNYLAKPANIKASVKLRSNLNLHPRPQFSWTALRWPEVEVESETKLRKEYPKGYCLISQYQNVIKYSGANALLFDPRTSEKHSDKTFIKATYFGCK